MSQGNDMLLATFANIRNAAGRGNDIFDQASAAVAQSPRSAAFRLGKALHQPVLATDGLGRWKQWRIRRHVNAGRVAAAQRIILSTLGRRP